jgi:hypothetical protein
MNAGFALGFAVGVEGFDVLGFDVAGCSPAALR